MKEKQDEPTRLLLNRSSRRYESKTQSGLFKSASIPADMSRDSRKLATTLLTHMPREATSDTAYTDAPSTLKITPTPARRRASASFRPGDSAKAENLRAGAHNRTVTVSSNRDATAARPRHRDASQPARSTTRPPLARFLTAGHNARGNRAKRSPGQTQPATQQPRRHQGVARAPPAWIQPPQTWGSHRRTAPEPRAPNGTSPESGTDGTNKHSLIRAP